jgi:WW domain
MSLTFASLFCGGGLTATTTTTPTVMDPSVDFDDSTKTMSFFCRPRRPNCPYPDVSQNALLDYPSSRTGPHSKPSYDTCPLVHDVVQENYHVMEGEEHVSKRINSTSNRLDGSSQTLYSVSKDVALSWMEMGKCSRGNPQHPKCHSTTANHRNTTTTTTSYWKAVAKQSRFSAGSKPLSDSTRHNRVEDTHGTGRSSTTQHRSSWTGTSSPQSSGPAHVELVPKTRLTPRDEQQSCTSKHGFSGSWKGITRTTSTSMTYTKIRTSSRSIPPAPPQYSHKRRFRVCFGVMSDWESAVDPQSGRTYYYNAVTRETQWRKPMELATEDERILMEEKERKQREFFSAMEANIIKSIAVGSVMSPAPITRKESVKPVRTKIIRTISSMDAGTLKDMIKRTPSTRNMLRKSSGDEVRISTLEKIVEADMEQSSLDFGNSSMSMFDESSANLGISLSEIRALKDLAQISKEMESISDHDEELDYSMTEGLDMSLQDFSVSLSDGLDFSIRDLAVDTKTAPAPKKTGNSSFMDSLVFSPEMIDKKSVSTNLEAGDIVFTPDVTHEPEPKKPPAVEKREEPNLRLGLKVKPPIVRRNTCGTLYVGSTMSAPDKDATIKVG